MCRRCIMGGLIDNYLNQSITLKTAGTPSAWGVSTYTTSIVAARWIYRRKVIRDATGNEIVSMAQCYLNTSVNPQDVINHDNRDWTILQVKPIVNFEGMTEHYEV